MTRIAEKIRKEMEEELMKLPGVVGISHENPKEKIIVYVESEAATLAVPRVLDGVEVETRVVGEVRVLEQAVALQRTARIRPAPGGVSIGHPETTAGTLGMVTIDGYILSNAHVIAPPTIAEVGDPVIQPGSFDGGCVETDKIGEVERFEEVKPLPDDNLIDAAIARVTCEDCVTREILEIGIPDGWTHAKVDMPVMKSGRTTGVTKSVIIDTNASIKVKGYAFGEASFKDQIIIDSPGASFADGGDSGSTVITRAEDGRLLVVGLLFAGSDRIAVANKIENVIDSLDIDIGPYHETELVETPSRFYGTVGTLTPLVFLGSLLTSEKLRR